jgi:hypothetical protein
MGQAKVESSSGSALLPSHLPAAFDKIGTFYYDKPILILVLDSPDNSCPRGWSLISGEYPDFLMVDQFLFFFFFPFVISLPLTQMIIQLLHSKLAILMLLCGYLPCRRLFAFSSRIAKTRYIVVKWLAGCLP